jgi:hypothetical protein
MIWTKNSDQVELSSNLCLQEGGSPAERDWTLPLLGTFSYRWLFNCLVSVSLSRYEFVAQRDVPRFNEVKFTHVISPTRREYRFHLQELTSPQSPRGLTTRALHELKPNFNACYKARMSCGKCAHPVFQYKTDLAVSK